MSDFVNFVDSYVEDNTVSMFDVHSEFIRITKMFIERFELEETVLFEMYESIICPHKKQIVNNMVCILSLCLMGNQLINFCSTDKVIL